MMLNESSGTKSLRDLLPASAYQQAKVESFRLKTVLARKSSLGFLEWTETYRPQLAPDKPFDLNSRRFLKAIYQDTAHELVIQKAAQRGASEYLVGWSLWSADVRNANVLYVFPTDRHVSEFSAARLGTAIDASPYLQELIVGGDERGADRVTLKRVRNRFIYFRGGKVGADGQAPQLKSIDGDAVVLDEFDEMDPRVDPIARKRLEASSIGDVRIISTPTFDGLGINTAYLASDQRVWMLQCQACNERQEIGLANLVLEWDELERPLRWYGQDPSTPLGMGTPFLACRKCGSALDRGGDGEWVAKFPERDLSGAPHGYHIHGLYSNAKPLPDLLIALREVNETKRQQTWNQSLGLTYASRQTSRLNRNVLDECRREYALGGTAQYGAYAGIDVGRLLHVIIRDSGTERKALFIGTVQSFEEALSLLEKFGVKTCVIDGLPETRKVRELQAAAKYFRVFAAFYSGEESAAAKQESHLRWVDEESTVHIDRTRSLDDTYGLFYTAARKESGNTLPLNARDIADYYDQLVAPVRKMVPTKDGNQRAVYAEGTEADHYCFVAGTLIETDKGQVPIEAMKPGMLVLTRKGYCRVLAAGLTQNSAMVHRYNFSNGASLVATPNHPVYVRGVGFVPLDAVNYGDIMETCHSHPAPASKPSFTKGLSFGATRTARGARIEFTIRRAANIARQVLSGCTKRFGKIVMEPFHAALPFITATETLTTTTLRISNAYRAGSTNPHTPNRDGRVWMNKPFWTAWRGFAHCPSLGIRLRRAKHYIASLPRIFALPPNIPTFVFNAEPLFRHIAPNASPRTAIAPRIVRLPFGAPAAKTSKRANARTAESLLASIATTKLAPVPAPVRTPSVRYLGSNPAGKLPVYNLTIEDAHEYYANGFLVHNCHAENYCAAARMCPLGRASADWV